MRKVKRIPGAVSKKRSKTKRDDERFRRNGLVCAAILSGMTEQVYAAQPGTQLLGFDLATLQARGIDPGVARYFRSAARFTEGVRVVGLTVNGDRIGLADVRFNHEGELCFTRGLLDRAGLQVPSRVLNKDAAVDQACHDFLSEYPNTVATLRPGSEEVFLVVPTQALRELQRGSGHYVRGGTAGMLNYDLQGSNSHSREDTNRYFSASTEVGFNFGDWIARSRQLYISTDGRSTTEHLFAYAQRDWGPLASTLQLGQISGISPVFGGVQLLGAQLFPDGVASGSSGGGVVVEGIALSQSRVEVRQSGALIYTTVVPEGPFSLNNLPLLNGTSDLQVSVIETRGGQRSFVVPAASFRATVPVKTGYTAGLGKVRDVDRSGAKEPLLGMASGTWALGKNSTLSSGVQGTDSYNSVGLALDSSFGERFSLGLRNNLARDRKKKLQGMRNSVSLGGMLPGNVQVSLSATTQTPGYREVLDTVRTVAGENDVARFKNQYTAGVSWAAAQVGAFSAGYSRATHFNSRSTQNVYGSWNKDFSYANVGVTVDSQVGSSGKTRGDNDGVGVRLQVTVPLGRERSLSSFARHQGRRSSMGTTYTERVDETLNYELRGERDLRGDREQAVGGWVNTLSRYAQVGAGVDRDASSTRYSGQLQGAVVAHDRGVTFTPYRVEDTFGVASAGDIAGARISTPQGPVWTDRWGMAVLPGLPAYQVSQLEIEGKSLPRQVDIKNGTKVLEAGRGSFSKVDFEVVKVRRVLLRATDTAGEPLAQGASVLGAGNAFLTNVVAGGMIFLSNIDSAQTLTVSSPSGASCTLQLDLAEQSYDERPYETASATCR
ncbi:fimbria/pilus outer membrane usher protein [Pseudomonas yamanorum]|uniref:fimbria/pilus outer membrane usher protein n=1 Tax=Pseudomonas yamanorum TaxID=515393 RepID=UPI003F7542FE